jgi:uncharacterized phage protein (TIGR01671 family)
MKDIKFRIWDKINSDFIDVENSDINIYYAKEGFKVLEFNPGDGWTPECGEFSSPSWSELDCDFMQYTGLKDKNGVEIYEGDIIKNIFDIILKVIWNEHRCRFEMVGIHNKSYKRLEIDCHIIIYLDIEVIGNIYENIELLGKDA